MSIQENIVSIKEQMAQAARQAGRDPSEILLCAATKMNDAENVKQAVAGGVDCCGENRVQELVQKLPLGAYTGKPVHFIGHLQTNKVGKVIGQVDLIQSVDRLELLACIDKEAAKRGLVQQILLEVNIGAEQSKSGFTPEELYQVVESMEQYGSVQVQGLMAIPPICEHPGANRQYFAQMRQLFVDIQGKKYNNVSMVQLSMGMSGDYCDAILEGSTMVRIGTAIFGARDYHK